MIGKFVFPSLVFICIVLIWVGSTMILTNRWFQVGDNKYYRDAGFVLLSGLVLAGGVWGWRRLINSS